MLKHLPTIPMKADNLLDLAHPMNYQCTVERILLSHRCIYILIENLYEPADQFYLCFEAACYYKLRPTWMGANFFQLGWEDYREKLIQFDNYTEYDSDLVRELNLRPVYLLYCKSSSFDITIFARNCYTALASDFNFLSL
jgi:hypothetical protein